MKKNSQIVFMSLAAAALCLSACSVTTSTDAAPAPQPKPNANVEGIWSSGCHYEPALNMYAIETLSFRGSTINDDLSQYYSSGCTGAAAKSESHAGTMNVVEASFWEPNAVNVDITFANASGALETHCFTTLVEGDKLYLPDPSVDTKNICPFYPHHVDRTRAFTKVG